MIVRRLSEIAGSHLDVHGETWNSRRFLLASDNCGFSMHDTIIQAGTETEMWYKNHIEAVYCIEGKGLLKDLERGDSYPISSGTMYILDKNDRYILIATTEMRMICVFNPPLTGNETHDKDGSYPAEQLVNNYLYGNKS